jgi:hypothetical protein
MNETARFERIRDDGSKTSNPTLSCCLSIQPLPSELNIT